MDKVKFTDFLKENKVSFYKVTQLMGQNPAVFTGTYKQKLTGERPMSIDDFNLICVKLGQLLNKPCKPSMFDFKVETVRLGVGD